MKPWFADSPEFVPEWDVYRDPLGNAVTVDCHYGHYDGELTEQQKKAVRHAARVWDMVCAHENSAQSDGLLTADGKTVKTWHAPNVAKSRLLWRMIHEGLPPTRTKPPVHWGGPEWNLLPGGDPFVTYPPYKEKKISIQDMTQGQSPNGSPVFYEIEVCGRCGSLVFDTGLHDGKCPR